MTMPENRPGLATQGVLLPLFQKAPKPEPGHCFY
jgi:hypothetical protein